MLKMCLNPKVIAGLAIAGVGVYLIAPNLIFAALPLLLLAACPLSMLLMGGAMMRGQGAMEGTNPPDHPQLDARAPSTSEEEVKALRAQLESLSGQQAALQEEVEGLRSAKPRKDAERALKEAEEITRAAGRK